MRAWLAALCAATLLAGNLSSAIDLTQFQRVAAARAQGRSIERVNALVRVIGEVTPQPVEERIRRINEFVNRNVRFEDDQTLYGVADYWATPLETMLLGAGDCEDFTIAKYFALRAAGVPTAQLRLIYVKAAIGGPNSGIVQAHMVLAWYPTPDAEPMVLDNLITDIRPASRRADLAPVFSFNSEGIWMGTGTDKSTSDTARLSRWRDLLTRARAEGFD